MLTQNKGSRTKFIYKTDRRPSNAVIRKLDFMMVLQHQQIHPSGTPALSKAAMALQYDQVEGPVYFDPIPCPHRFQKRSVATAELHERV